MITSEGALIPAHAARPVRVGDALGMLTINLKTPLHRLPQDWRPAPWCEEYDTPVIVEAGIVSESEEVLNYDDWEWVCRAYESGATERHCGPDTKFRNEYELDAHLECEAIAYCDPPGNLVGGCYELSFEFLRRWSPGDRTARAQTLLGDCIYLVQMHPEAAPLEIKAGFSKNLRARLKSYRTGSPSSQLIAAKPGTPHDEHRLLVKLRAIGVPLSAEVFRVRSVDDALRIFSALKADDEDAL